MRNLFDIKDRVMVITGGTGVLGTSMTEYLAEQGAKMVVLGRNKDKGDAIVNNIKEKGGEAKQARSSREADDRHAPRRTVGERTPEIRPEKAHQLHLRHQQPDVPGGKRK